MAQSLSNIKNFYYCRCLVLLTKVDSLSNIKNFYYCRWCRNTACFNGLSNIKNFYYCRCGRSREISICLSNIKIFCFHLCERVFSQIKRSGTRKIRLIKKIARIIPIKRLRQKISQYLITRCQKYWFFWQRFSLCIKIHF